MALSSYAQGLNPENMLRYKEKLSHLAGIDPYTLKAADFDGDFNRIPSVTYKSIVDYLLFRASPFTRSEMQAYKSLDAFVRVVCKWIKSLRIKEVNNYFLIMGKITCYFKPIHLLVLKCKLTRASMVLFKWIVSFQIKEVNNYFLIIRKVMHSQRISESYLNPWIILNRSAEVLCAHCDCIAGLGEVCSHVAAILFSLEHSTTNLQPGQSVTDVLAYWIAPTKKEDFYLTLAEVDFTSPVQLKKVCIGKVETPIPTAKPADPPQTSRDDVTGFLTKWKNIGCSSALHSLLKPFCLEEEQSKNPLCSLFNEDNRKCNLEQLYQLGHALEFNLDESQCTEIEAKTKSQASCKYWFQQRTGRITASRFKAACRTKGAISLIKSICYPDPTKKFKQGVYGCKHEAEALQQYRLKHQNEHPGTTVESSGFIIHPNYPHFGASPDGIVKCQTCGEGCVEVKCPYCAKDTSIAEEIQEGKFYVMLDDNFIQLNRNHAYFYQVQMQLALSEKQYCDFVVWSSKDFYIERIHLDKNFWQKESALATKFFQRTILPELHAKFFTLPYKLGEGEAMNQHTATESCQEATTSSKADVVLWCICRKPDDGSVMLMCENETCTLKWYHKKCLRIKKVPKGKWLCDECKK